MVSIDSVRHTSRRNCGVQFCRQVGDKEFVLKMHTRLIHYSKHLIDLHMLLQSKLVERMRVGKQLDDSEKLYWSG